MYRDEGLFKVTLAKARDELIDEIHRLCRYSPGDPCIVISSNLTLRNDGLPYANQRAPDDPGVAVYFTYKGKQRVFACDRFRKVEHNIRAIGKTIEALRGIERWASSEMMDRAFTGFDALPPPDEQEGGVRLWWQVLGVTPEASRETVQAAYRRLRGQYHPDRGESGSRARFDEVQQAWEQYSAAA